MRRYRPGWTMLALGWQIATLLLAGTVALQAGEIYRYVDQQGVIHLANRPEGRSASVRRGVARPRGGGGDAPARLPDPGRDRYDEHIRAAAERFRVEPELIKAVIHAESGFNRRAVSRKGARGLMQLMPGTARQLGVSDSFDPRENIFGGTRYLREMLDRYGNDLRLGLAAYNAGPEAVDRSGGVPPYPETRSYVSRVSRLMQRYGGVPAPAGDRGRIYRVVKDGRVLLTNRALP